MGLGTKDYALIINGIGSLAGAFGQYKTDKERNKLIKEELEYKKSLDTDAINKQNKAQKNLDDAFSESDFNIKNKKKKNLDALGNEIVDDTTTAD